MLRAAATLYFDFIDPLSYLLERELHDLGEELASAVTHVPFELRPPPTPLVAIGDVHLARRWTRAKELATSSGICLSPPALVP